MIKINVWNLFSSSKTKTSFAPCCAKLSSAPAIEVDEAPDGPSAIQKVRARRYLLVITDLKMPGASGLDVLRETKQADSTVPVLLLTAFGSVDEAVTAMKEGAFDFLQKPVDLEHLKLLVGRAARQQELLRENLILREEYSARYGFPRILGEDASIREVSQQIQKVAATDSTVLLLGESGTGKELFARAIHHLSPRATSRSSRSTAPPSPKTWSKTSSSATSAARSPAPATAKLGKLELAHGGTLFLDEIGELPLAIQAKLLRVLEERRFDRVGGTQSHRRRRPHRRRHQPRSRASSSTKNVFREDLFFRISRRAPHHSAAARPRRRHHSPGRTFPAKNSAANSPSPASNSPPKPASASLHYRWPGNVRELQNTLERAVILADGVSILAEDLQLPAPKPDTAELPEGLLPESFSWEGSLEDVTTRAVTHVEKILLETTLRECTWNKTRAAEKLGVSPKTLLTKLRAAGLED